MRRVARKAVLLRAMTAKLEKANADVEAKKAALAEAERLKVRFAGREGVVEFRTNTPRKH